MLVPLLQALLFCRLVSFIRSLVPSNTPGGWGEIAPVSRSWIGVGVGVLRLVVLLLVLHQVVQVVYRLVAVRSGLDAAVGAVCGLGLLQGLWYFLRAAGEGRVGGGLRGFLCVVALIAVVRVVWILNVDSYQSTDYARYLQIGEQIYDGRWDLLASRGETLTPIYIRRALFATLPAIWLFGKGLAGLEC
ncbi:MAG: hypothetical protein ACOVRM_02915, partial [Planctomycetaceae bacterium]